MSDKSAAPVELVEGDEPLTAVDDATLNLAAASARPADLVKPVDPATPAATESGKPASPGTGKPATVITQAELITPVDVMGGKGKGNRTLDDYAKLDWTKSNSEIARDTGVSRQRVQQIRQQLADRATKAAVAESESVIGGLPPGAIPGVDVNGGGPTEAQPAIAKATVNYQLLAETTFNMGTGLLTMIIGPEWQPRKLPVPGTNETVDEKAAVVDALRVYYEAKQVQDLPPGIMLTFVLCSYAAPRFAVPNTRNKFQLGWTWVKVKFSGWFSKRRRGFVPAIVARPTEANGATTTTAEAKQG